MENEQREPPYAEPHPDDDYDDFENYHSSHDSLSEDESQFRQR